MTSHADIETTASDWLARRDGEQWSDDLQQELDAWLARDTSHRVAFLRLDSVWKRTHRLSALRAPRRGGAAAVRQPLRSQTVGWRIAAAIVGVALVTAGGGYWWDRRDVVAYESPIGAQRPVVLPDGTHVILNTQTRLNTSVDAGHRYAQLDQGEAYFEVAHDAAHPFIVDAGSYKITVLGTKFSVRREASTVRVAVAEGRVRVERTGFGGPGRTVVLMANDLVTATAADTTVSRHTAAQLSNDLSWRTGRLSFEDMTLESAASEFNRYNEKKLVVDSATGQMRIGGSFKAENVEAFARFLHEGFGLTVLEDGTTIRVSTPHSS